MVDPSNPCRNGLAGKTFGALTRPQQSWHWGDVRLIDQPGSYGEEFTSVAGDPDVVGELLRGVVDIAHHNARRRTLAGQSVQSLGVGLWRGRHWDLLVVMGIRDDHQLCPMSQVSQHYPDVLDHLHLLAGMEQLMDGASDTFWGLVDRGLEQSSCPESAFDLATRLASGYQLAQLGAGGPKGSALLAWHRSQHLLSALPVTGVDVAVAERL